MKQRITIDGVAIKTPHEFSIERYNLTKSGRVVSGKMVMDLVAKKRKFNLAYEVLEGSDLTHILNLIDGDKMFFEVTYFENGVEKTATCYAGAIPSTVFRTGSKWYWKNVKFALIEQ